MLSRKNNAAATDSLLRTYYEFNRIIFDLLKAYHQTALEPDVEIDATSGKTSYDIPGLNMTFLKGYSVNAY